MGSNPRSLLSPGQIAQKVYDETNDRIRVDAQYTANLAGELEVAIDASEDSIAIKSSTTGNELQPNADGSINVDVINSSLPNGAATEVTLSAFKSANHSDLVTIQGKQDTGNTTLAEIASDTDNLDTPLSTRASEFTLLGTNTKLDAANISLSSIDGKLTNDFGSSTAALRTAAQIGNSSGSADFGAGTTSAQTVRVVLPTDQTFIPVSQSGTWNINNISGTVSLPTGAATAIRQDTGNTSLASIDTKLTDKSQFTKITDGTDTALVTSAGELNVLATAQPGVDIGDVTINNTGGASAVNIQDGGNSITVDGTVSAVQSGTWNINNISGTVSLPTGAATETTLAKLTLAQASTTSGEFGPLVQGAVTTSSPSYNNGQTDPLSLTTAGALRVDGSGVTQPVSGTVTVNQGTSPWVENVSQFGGSNVVTGTGNSGAGIPRVTVSNDSSITNITGTISLPTGAATSANQATEIASLASIDAGIPASLGQTTMANSMSVVIASNQTAVSVTATNLPTTVDTNYGTVGASTIRTASEIGNATGAALFGAGTTTAQVLRVVLPTDQTSIPAAQSGTWTVQQGTPPWQVTGNVASAATDSGNPVKIGTVFNTTLPTVTNGQRIDSQADSNGRLLVANTPLDGSKSTYSTSITALAAAATPTDIFTITGSASKTVRVTRIEFSGTQTTAAMRDILLIKRSAANSGGTSTTPTIAPHDSGDAGASAVVRAYTANPAALGATVGTIRVTKYDIDSTNLSSASGTLIWDFGTRPSKAVILRGTSEVLAINLNSVTSSGNSLNISIEWTEE